MPSLGWRVQIRFGFSPHVPYLPWNKISTSHLLVANSGIQEWNTEINFMYQNHTHNSLCLSLSLFFFLILRDILLSLNVMSNFGALNFYGTMSLSFLGVILWARKIHWTLSEVLKNECYNHDINSIFLWSFFLMTTIWLFTNSEMLSICMSSKFCL